MPPPPLSAPVERELLHRRTVQCQGFRRTDGLWDIEGHMTDIKTYDVANKDRNGIPAGVPIHEMWLRLTLDDRFTITAAEAATQHAPFNVCAAITPNYGALIGLTVGPGFMSKAKQRFSGEAGCTHMTELLGPMATTAIQTIYSMRARLRRKTDEEYPETAKKPAMIGQCHALAEAGEVVAREWPQFSTRKSR